MPEQAENPLLQQLRDVHLPADVGWWPPAIGWWLLALILGWLLYRLARYWLAQYRQSRYKKQALLELDTYLLAWQQDDQDSAYLQAANGLLRRVCLHLQDGQKLSAQIGQQWADNLNRYSKAQLDPESILALTHGAYRKQPAAEVERLHKNLSSWIKQHQTTPLDKPSDASTEEPDYA